MRKFALSLGLAGLVCFFLPVYAAIVFPVFEGYVTDKASILTTSQRHTLENASQTLEKATGAQVATVVITSTEDVPIEEYANRLFEKWGVGEKKKDKGVLFVVALQDKKMRIEVGYGLEGVITDGASGQILDTHVLPYFRKGQFAEGITQAHLVLSRLIAEHYGIEGASVPSRAPVKQSRYGAFGQLAMFVILLILAYFFRDYIWMLLPFLLMGGGGGYSSGSFGSFGGSGFGGFGGGRSGGGGASRGW